MQSSSTANRWAFACCLLGAALLVWLTQGEPFFWDTVQLGAMQGDWFYQQGYRSGLLPDRIDSGHVPAFGWYLAAIWQLGGQNLVVTHWSMWPWIALVAYQWWRLLKHRQERQWKRSWGMGLLLASPVVMSQLSLMSPDVLLMGSFLLALNSIYDRRRFTLALAIVLLGLISMRGMLVAGALFCWELYRAWPLSFRQRWFFFGRTLLPYLPGGLLVLSYFGYHYHLKGWVVVHDDSPWAASFATNQGWAKLRQLGILVWRLIDFGYVFVWLGLIGLIWRTTSWSKANTDSLVLASILLLFLGIPIIMGSGLAQHRYLLPFFLVLSYLLWALANAFPVSRKVRTLGLLLLLGLGSGNFWVYPTGIAQGWDATLLHKAFIFLENNSKKILSEENILTSEVCAAFPLLAPQHYYWLNDQWAQRRPYEQRHLRAGHCPYVLYSNVMNEFEATDLELLRNNCDTVYHRAALGVNYTLYQCPP